MKILVNAKPFNENVFYQWQEDFKEAHFVFEKEEDKIKEEIKDADALITFKLSDEALAKAEKLKWIQAMTAGVDFLPLTKINNKNSDIVITTARGAHKSHITEYIISMMIVSARNLNKFIIEKDKKEKRWNISPQDEISGKKLGILGLGSIGQHLAKTAHFLGMEVYGVKRTVEEVDFVEKVFTQDNMDWFFENCDYIVNLLPATEYTANIVNKKYFDMLKPTCTMINAGRGKTVDEDDLYLALKNNQFKLYISDVFAEEPLPKDNPLWDLDNIIITPHIAGPTANYTKKLYEVIKPNIKAFIDGKALKNEYKLNRGY
ncbi:D-2-hydroxyacid dehydrogenase [Clostridium sp. DL1XJH146]